MSLIERPLNVLIAASEPRDRSAVESLLTALERQGDAVSFTWIGATPAESLCARLADTPSVDLLAWDGPANALDEALARMPEDQALPPLAILLVDQIAPLSRAFGSAGTLQLCRNLAGVSATAAIEAFLAAILAGQAPSSAYAQAQEGLASRGTTTRLSSGRCELPIEQAILWEPAGADEPLMDAAPADGSGVERVVRFPSPELAPAWQRLPLEPLPGGLPEVPSAGFVGRGQERAAIEEALEPSCCGTVWLYGRMGIGKTTLALETARWMVRTGAFDRIVYVNFGGGGSAELALYSLGRSLVGRDWNPRDGQALSQVIKALGEHKALVIWDQVDAVLPKGAVPLDPEGRHALWELAAQLLQAGARMIVLADAFELPADAAGTNPRLSLRVGPLDESDALNLWSRLVPTECDVDAAQALVHALGAHPLGMMLSAAALPDQTASDVLAGLTEMMPGVATGEGRIGNQALDIGLECLMRSLGEDTRALLDRLGLYTKGFMQALALTLMGLDTEVWEPIQKRLSQGGVITALRMPGFSVPYVRLHPALERYLAGRVAGEARARWEPIYIGGYMGLLNWLLSSAARSPEHVQFLVHCELGNLLKTMRLLIANKDMTRASDALRGLTHFCAEMGLNTESQRLVESFEAAVKVVVPEQGPLGRQGVQFMLQRADELLNQRRVPQAGALLQQLIQRMAAENGLSYGGDDAALDRALVTQRLARAVLAMGRPDAALASLAQALQALPSPTDDKLVLAARLNILQEQVELLRSAGATDPALEASAQALELATQLDTREAVARLQSERGVLLTIKGELADARQAYETAMFEYKQLGAEDRVASVWEGLSQVAWQENDLAKAQECLDNALSALPEDHPPAQEAHIHRSMAQIAEIEGRVVDAERDYGVAIRIYQDHRILPELVTAEMALARLLLAHGRHQEAHIHAEAARASAEKMGPQAVPWEIFELLRDVALAEGDEASALRWRGRAQEVFAASPAAENVRAQWRELIRSVSDACRGSALGQEIVDTVEKLEEAPQWQSLAGAIWQVLGGERDPEAFAVLDPIDAVVVRATLDAIENPIVDEVEEEAADED